MFGVSLEVDGAVRFPVALDGTIVILFWVVKSNVPVRQPKETAS